MSLVTNIKIKIRALWISYGSIVDLVDPKEKVSMIVKCLLQRSFCYEVTSDFYHFTEDIKKLFFAHMPEIRYAALNWYSWLLAAKSKITILLDGLKGISYD